MSESGRFNIIILYACMVHYASGLALLLDPSSVGITAINAVVLVTGSRLGAAGLFIGAGSLAIVGLGTAGTSSGILLMAPQQFTLLVSAGGAIDAMATGHFADGTVRSHWFLIADQFPAVAAAIGHTIALIRMGTPPWKPLR